MRFIHKTAVALMVVVLLAGAAFAAPAVDSETTTTATTSDLTAGQTISDFNASDTAQLPTLQASYDTTNPGIKVIDPETGATIEYFKNSTDSSYFTSTGGTGPYYYNTTFNESDFAAMPMEASENKSVTLRLIGNTSADNPATTNVTIYLNNTDERAVIYASDEVTGDAAPSGSTVTADFNEDVGAFGFDTLAAVPGLDTYDTFSVDGESVGVNGSATDVYVVYASNNASTAFDAAVDRKRIGSYEDGDWVKYYQLSVQGTNYKVFNAKAPDEAPASSYGVTTSVGPTNQDAIRVNLGDDVSDRSTVDVSSTANNKYGFIAAAGIYARSLGLSMGVVLIVGGTIGLRRQREKEEE